MSWPPLFSPAKTNGLSCARAKYVAAAHPAGPEPIIMTCSILIPSYSVLSYFLMSVSSFLETESSFTIGRSPFTLGGTGSFSDILDCISSSTSKNRTSSASVLLKFGNGPLWTPTYMDQNSVSPSDGSINFLNGARGNDVPSSSIISRFTVALYVSPLCTCPPTENTQYPGNVSFVVLRFCINNCFFVLKINTPTA